MSKLVDLDHKWAKEIGRVFISFGSIEHVTMECLKQIPKDNIFDITRHFKLGQRIDLILQLLEPYKEKQIVEFKELLKKAKSLAAERNLLAHNPLMLNVYGNEEGEFKLEEKITSMKNEKKHMSFNALQKLANETEALTSSIHKALNQVLTIAGNKSA